VADGADRSKGASHRFMKRFAGMVENFAGIGGGTTYLAGEIPILLERFRTHTETLMAQSPYTDASTLTALLLVPVTEGFEGLLFHCGDSLLLRFTPETAMEQVSESNFWLLGRSKKLYQVERVSVPWGSVFVLTTDGISDLKFPGTFGMEGCLAQCILEHPVEAVPRKFIGDYDRSPSPVDDLAMVAVRPEEFGSCTERVFLMA